MKISVFLIAIALFSSCEAYLDERPDKSLAIPLTLSDLQALLDNTAKMSEAYPLSAELASDDYYVTYEDWLSRDLNTRNAYIWDKNIFKDTDIYDWTRPYEVVFYANVVLEGVEKIMETETSVSPDALGNVKGQALFFRAFAFHQLAQLFALPYDPVSSITDLGIPLRLSSDLNRISTRATVQETYERIIQDAKEAAALLPVNPKYKTRPSKTAAFGLLARVYLHMSDYINAGSYADSCLTLYPLLMDYNTLAKNKPNPIPMFNDEVIFHSTFLGRQLLNPSTGKIDSLLHASYADGDLRRTIFFEPIEGQKGVGFSGNYAGSYILPFNGLATDEMYLIRAECFGRNNNIDKALNDLNILLRNRHDAATFAPLQIETKDELLRTILEERRKELVFRGLRWSDLRRLNKDPRFAITIKRELNGQIFELPPNGPRYVFPIPQLVIAATGMSQNE